MFKALILSASTGQGHNQAAKSLKIALEESKYTVHIAEPLKEEGKIMDYLFDDGYNILATKLPKIYGKLYKFTGHKVVNKGVGTFLNITLSRTIYQLVQEHQPNLLIVTHAMFVNIVSTLKITGKIDMPFISVVTDYRAHQLYVNTAVDAYIVASSFTKDTLLEKGVSEHKIYVYGIPINEAFRKPRQVNPNHPFTLLLMGGSMGISYIKNCLHQLVENPYPLRIFVICGNNDKLKSELDELYRDHTGNKQIEIFGFTTDIPKFMDQSDVIITKPGGLTVTEAINKTIPIIIPFFIPGQEEENTEVLVKACLLYTSEAETVDD